jgi:two-component system, chemotaxis family, sensor kinase CheA
MEQTGLIKYLILPSEITEVELAHVRKINRVALLVCILHIPLFLIVSYLCHTSMLQAIVFGSLLVAGPAIASKTISNPRTLSLVYGFTSMCLGALLVHLGQGPVQIEMHFHFFASLALLAVWGNPLIIWVATVTVAVHHGLFWYFIPNSVFNYDAPFWVVLVHAGFVVVEAIAASYIARNFYDNVIGLEKIVTAKTKELNARNEEMRLILDNTSQAFFVIDPTGKIGSERSAVFNEWFGTPGTSEQYSDFLSKFDSEFSKLTKFAFEEIKEGLLPLDYYLDNFPSRLKVDKNGESLIFEFKYSPVDEKMDSFLVVVTNITEKLKVEREVRRQLEVINIFNMISKDRDGFEDYLRDSEQIVNRVTGSKELSNSEVARLVHTLKGNSGVFQVSSLADVCHKIESNMSENQGKISNDDKTYLKNSWSALQNKLNQFLTGSEKGIDVTREELLGAIKLIEDSKPITQLKQVLNSWSYEPAKKRLERLSYQAQSLAKRLNKPELSIECKDNGLRFNKDELAGFWSIFSHILRNAIDHGIETEMERKNKPKNGKLVLETVKNGDTLIIAIEDDGKGISLEQFRNKTNINDTNITDQVLLDLICQEGVSSKVEVTDISGRGVGMSAVKSYCDQHGVKMSLKSKAGRGTRFEFAFVSESVS